MSEIRLNRAQRRQLQKLADKVDRITQADRRFFERFPYRKFRVRIAGQAEIEQQKLLDGKPVNTPPGYRMFCDRSEPRTRQPTEIACGGQRGS